MITIIIPYRNEPNLIETIKQIRRTTNNIPIILIDDCNEEPIRLNDNNITIIRNPKRMGVGYSFTKGVRSAKTKYLCLIGADTRFKNNNWLERMINELKKNPKSIITSANYGQGKKIIRYGADILMFLTNKDLPKYSRLKHIKNYRNVIEAKWRKKTGNGSYSIPCIFGACYVITKKWFEYIKGFEGHKIWGTLEPFISLKSWLAGGDCKIISNVETGHIYEEKFKNPFPLKYAMYNKLFVAKTLMPEIYEKIDKHLGNNDALISAREMISLNSEYIGRIRNYNKSIFKKNIYQVLQKFETL